ncbi:hypothetical protein [Sporosarcina limicola]|uniref:Uncharacterized protein n=1 Tax=Sporosarcina limicola TaxID=34101 RepID=A0A927MMB6_9BACL|nr:hypothetical protein [Sporosarcina limicola]MBE1553841.1 hypothetical protein [Sporosarcina limicola]
MALAIIITISLLLGAAVLLICGKENFKGIITPLLILWAGDFLLLYAKFVVGDSTSTFFLYFPAMILLGIPVIWLITIVVKSNGGKDSEKIVRAIVFSLTMTIIIVFAPSLKSEGKFKLYQNDFYAVSDAIFQAYDDGKVSVGEHYSSWSSNTNDLETPNSVFSSNEIVKKMEKLEQSAGVYGYNLVDKDVIYFSFGAVFQSISGIAICRNGKDLFTDETLESQPYDGVPTYKYIADGIYHFSDGL